MADDDTVVQRGARPKPRARPAWASLCVLSGRQVGATYRVGIGATIVGRGTEAHLRIVDEGVSRRHARLIRDGDGMTKIVDLDSTNGTFVNERRIVVEALREGDRIRIGKSATLDFRYDYADEPSAVSVDPLGGPRRQTGSNHAAEMLGQNMSLSDADAVKTVAACRQILAIREANFGAEHPAVAAILDSLATLERGDGDFEGALGHQQRALQIYSDATRPGQEPPEFAHLLTHLGETLLGLRRASEALEVFERGLGLLEVRLADDTELAWVRFGIARTLDALAREPVRSRTLALLAREGFARSENARGSLVAVDRFLART